MAHQRMHLDRFALHEHGLERLETQAVERRRAVEQHGVLLDDLLEHVPDLRDHRVDHLLGRLDVLDGLALDEAGHDERLEQLEGHQLRQAALMELEARAGHDDRAARVVHALTQQVLPEAALLALEHVRERLQRAVARARDGPAAATVVEQSVDGLLQHPLLVVDDDLGRAEVEQPLQAVVAVDHAPVEVVQVRGRKAATVELHHRAQLRRDHRHGLEDHVLGLVLGVDEGRDDLQALDRAALLLALGGLDLLLEALALVVEVDLLEQVAHRLGAHAAAEVLAESERRAEAVLELAEDGLVRDHLLGSHLAEQVPDLPHALGSVLDVGLGVRDVGVEDLLDVLLELLPIVVGELLDVDVERLRPQHVVVGEAGLLAGLQVLEPALERLLQLLHALLLLGLVGVENLRDFLLELAEVLLARLVVHVGDDRSREVEDLLQLLGRHVEQVADARRHALEEPDVRDRGGEVHVPHALAAHLGTRDLNAAALADDALIADALVLAAVALPVLRGTEDALTEETVLLRLERPVVNGFRLGDLAGRPTPNLLRGSEPDADRVEIVDVNHCVLSLFLDVLSVLLGRGFLCLSALAFGFDGFLGLVVGSVATRGADAREVDAELLGGAQQVVVLVADLDSCALLGADVDVERQRLHLLEQHLEGLGNRRLGDVLALDDRLVGLHAPDGVVGLDREHLLEGVRGAVGLERPHLHLAKALAAELRLAAQRLLGDERVGAGLAGGDLVAHQTERLEPPHAADR